MKTFPFENVPTNNFELSSQLSFGHISQSAPYWHGVGYGFLPQLVGELSTSAHKNSYLLSFGQRQLVLSVDLDCKQATDEGLELISPMIEEAYRAGIAPHLVYVSTEKGFVVTEYIEGQIWGQDDFHHRSNIQRVAQVLKKLHALPIDDESLSVSAQQSHQWMDSSETPLPAHAALQHFQQPMQQVLAHIEQHYPDRALCHNNLHSSNIVEHDHRLCFLSWESASINDPYFDLAAIAHKNSFDNVQIDQLLFHYTGQVSEEQRDHFYYCYTVHIYFDLLACLAENAQYQQAELEQTIEQHIERLQSLLTRLGD